MSVGCCWLCVQSVVVGRLLLLIGWCMLVVVGGCVWLCVLCLVLVVGVVSWLMHVRCWCWLVLVVCVVVLGCC